LALGYYLVIVSCVLVIDYPFLANMFSSDSRWDRHTPEQGRQEDIIDVAAVFKKGKAAPTSFVWNQRRYTVKEVTYHWREKRGSDFLHFYTVTDRANLYTIYLNTRYLHWRLVGTCPIE